MRNALFIFFIFISSMTFAHDYYFAFAEVEYDEMKGELQATLIVSTHDMENFLRKKGVTERDLSSYCNDTIALRNIQNELLKGFSIQIGTKTLNLTLEGMEVQLTGLTNFYFSAKEVSALESVSIKFDLLMDVFAEQQNKLTFIYRNTKNTYVFLSNRKEQDIILLEK